MSKNETDTSTKKLEPAVFKLSATVFALEFISIIVVCIALVIIANNDVMVASLLIAAGLFLLTAITIRFLFTSITVGEHYIEYRKGWLMVSKKQIPYDNVHTVDLNIDVMGNIFNYGNIKIFTGNDLEGISFKIVDRPEELKDLIESFIAAIEESKQPLPTSNNISDADEIKKFSELYKQGIITKKEFELEKKKLLGE